MFFGSHKLEFGVNHTITRTTQQATLATTKKDNKKPTTKDNMKAKFQCWGVELKFMIIFAHIDN